MSVDAIADMLSQIRNACMVKKDFVEVPYTKICESVAKVLSKSGFLGNVKVFKEKGSVRKGIHLALLYDSSGDPKITAATRVSKLGRRVYCKSGEIKGTNERYEVVVVSTSKGVMLGADARKKGLGGEIICEVR